jgi:hypothetical protein
MSVDVLKRWSRKRTSFASRFVVRLVAITFALQSYITQTHIHGVSHAITRIAKVADTKASGQSKAPADNSQSECPLCQAVTQSGVFVAAATLTLHLPLVWITTVAFAFSAGVISSATAHNWQSRAPPLR